MARRGQDTRKTTVKLTPLTFDVLEVLGHILGMDTQDLLELAVKELADKWLNKPWICWSRAEDGTVVVELQER
jgi:hypothetical protein